MPPDDYGPLDEACRARGEFDWIVFSSANAVDAFIGRLLASPLDLRVAQRRRSSAPSVRRPRERLARYGLKVDLVPDESRAEAVVQAMVDAGHRRRAERVLLPRADIGREVIADELRKRGADVTEVVAYRTVAARPRARRRARHLPHAARPAIDVVTFTSPSAVRNFVELLGAEPAADLLRTTVVASIGPVTAEAAAQYNIHTTIMPAHYTIPALVDAIVGATSRGTS